MSDDCPRCGLQVTSGHEAHLRVCQGGGKSARAKKGKGGGKGGGEGGDGGEGGAGSSGAKARAARGGREKRRAAVVSSEAESESEGISEEVLLPHTTHPPTHQRPLRAPGLAL